MNRQEQIGRFLLGPNCRGMFPDYPLSVLADMYARSIATTPGNPKHESIGTQTAEVYKQHLREQGDKYSMEMLRHLEEGTELSEDPGGN